MFGMYPGCAGGRAAALEGSFSERDKEVPVLSASMLSGGSGSQALLGGRSPERDEEVPVPVVSPLEGCSSSEEVGAGFSLR